MLVSSNPCYPCLSKTGANILAQLGWKNVMDVIKSSPSGGSLLAGALALDGKIPFCTTPDRQEQNGGQVSEEIFSYILDWAHSDDHHSDTEIIIALGNIALNKKGISAMHMRS